MAPRRGGGSCGYGAGGVDKAQSKVAGGGGGGGGGGGRAESQSVSALRSESEETTSLKGPASTSLIRQKWKKVSQWQP